MVHSRLAKNNVPQFKCDFNDVAGVPEQDRPSRAKNRFRRCSLIKATYFAFNAPAATRNANKDGEARMHCGECLCVNLIKGADEGFLVGLRIGDHAVTNY